MLKLVLLRHVEGRAQMIQKWTSVTLAIFISVVSQTICHADEAWNAMQEQAKIRHERLELARRYRQDNKYREAKQQYELCIKEDPIDPTLYIQKGYMELELKDYASAAADAERVFGVTSFNGHLRQAELLLAKAKVGMKQIDEAIKHYRNACNRLPEDPETNFELGKLLVQNKQYDEALEHLKDAQKSLKRPHTNPRLLRKLPEIDSLIEGIHTSESKKHK